MSVDVVDQLTESDARALTDELRCACDELTTWYERAIALVQRAYRGRAWLALGHPSWETYLKHELPFRPALDRDTRRSLVRALRQEGLSTRAIAPVVDVSHRQVGRELSTGTIVPAVEAPGSNGTIGLDGRTYLIPQTMPIDSPVSASAAVMKVVGRIRGLLHAGSRVRREIAEVVRLREEIPTTAVRELYEALDVVIEQAQDLKRQLQEES